MNNRPDENYNDSNNFDDYDMSYLDYYDSNDDYISNYNKISNKDEIEYDYGYGDPSTKSYNQNTSNNNQNKVKQDLNKETSKNIKKLKSKVTKTGKKRRKLKKDIKFKIISGVILLVLGIGVALYFNTDIFRTKREVFIKYFDQTFEATKILEDESNSA
jgi:ABC-type antimicrobial peptide transport system permease subunit